MSSRHVHVALAFAAALAIAGPADAQATQTGNISNGASVYYTFTPLASGQLIATLSWDSQPATLFLVLVCGTSDPVSYGVGAGQLDRTARLEAGILGLNPCVIGVSGMPGSSAAYRLNAQHSTDQLVTVRPATVQGLTPSTVRPLDARLVEGAERTLTLMKTQVR